MQEDDGGVVAVGTSAVGLVALSDCAVSNVRAVRTARPPPARGSLRHAPCVPPGVRSQRAVRPGRVLPPVLSRTCAVQRSGGLVSIARGAIGTLGITACNLTNISAAVRSTHSRTEMARAHTYERKHRAKQAQRHAHTRAFVYAPLSLACAVVCVCVCLVVCLFVCFCV